MTKGTMAWRILGLRMERRQSPDVEGTHNMSNNKLGTADNGCYFSMGLGA